MFSKVNKQDIDAVDVTAVDGVECSVRQVGIALKPEKMRFNIWEFDSGDSNNRHKHGEQEELYYVIDGSGKLDVNDETVDLEEGDLVTISPDAWRRIRATDDLTVLAVGAPNVENDGIPEPE